jgi:hypothetical protein
MKVTQTTAAEIPAKLPLWRLMTGIAVLGSFVAVIGLLTPVYLDDFRLYRYVKSISGSTNTPDETLRAEVIARAHELDLPVHANDIHVVHGAGKTKIEMRYTVKMDIVLYPVDLHFPTIR